MSDNVTVEWDEHGPALQKSVGTSEVQRNVISQLLSPLHFFSLYPITPLPIRIDQMNKFNHDPQRSI